MDRVMKNIVEIMRLKIKKSFRPRNKILFVCVSVCLENFQPFFL